MVRSKGFRGFRVETEHLKKTLGRRRDANGIFFVNGVN